ncbi:MFS transporter [Microtetraspora sp. AC03309]|uniref:MFS transporter n=1 Tax=Microtetraspora sp. AC03309 TaxID=2779376 RepID=UPI001E4E6235|nr:MFS transporter [Microtetraspora sp. AC03309]MCC5581940.1 MFS transporter [Microtetraspora sp. AC03309]
MSVLTPFRLARTTAFAAVCVGLGVLAHLFAGGTLSGPRVVVGLILAFAAALPWTGRERGLAVILPLLGGLQVAMHLLFSVSVSSAGDATPYAEAGAHLHSGLVPGVGMLVMHGWAVGLTALWLSHGEAMLWSLLRRLAARLCLLLDVLPAPALTPFHASRSTEPEILRTRSLRHAVSRRGPPMGVALTSR